MATHELDARPTLRAGGEPFAQIMQITSAMAQGDTFRLLATFEPKPLFHVLGSQGFSHQAREIGPGDWEVIFTKDGAKADNVPQKAAEAGTDWPDPVRTIDNRGLEPPEPMVITLSAIETMEEGEVLESLLEREPVFLYRELAKRGHRWKGGFEDENKTFRLFVRKGDGAGA